MGCETHGPEHHRKMFMKRDLEETKKELAKAIEQDSTLKPEGVKREGYHSSNFGDVPFTLHSYGGDQNYSAYNFYHNGIRYIGVFLDNESSNSAAVVDYSQFFNKDTVMVSGRTWVAITSAPAIEQE